MHADDLQKFIASLDQAGELSRITCPVDPNLEVAAIIDATCRDDVPGQALLFENVQGSPLPLAANLFASQKRLELAIGSDIFTVLPKRLKADLAASGAADSSAALRKIVTSGQHQAVYATDAPCFGRDAGTAGLDILPALRSWPEDGGKYLTLAQVFTYHPDTLLGNCGMYRVQLLDRDKALLRCHPGSGGADHLSAWHNKDLAMPLAITLGGPPILTWLAGVSLPGEVTETAFAGYAGGRPLVMARCLDPHLAVPATAEIVIEGRIFPGEELMEGPFGNHTGRYEAASLAPLMRVERISMRERAICPCTLVGPPPRENSCLAELTARTLQVLLQFDHPWVHAVHLPAEGAYHRAAMVAIAPNCPLSVQEISKALWASALLKNARLLILLDSDTPLSDFGAVYWRVVNTHSLVEACHVDAHKVVLDARSPAGARRVSPDEAIVKKVMARWQEYGCNGLK